MIDERQIAGVSVGWIGIGTQMLGASLDLGIRASERVLHAAFDAGSVFVDTADVYAPSGAWTGQAERLVGEALRSWRGAGRAAPFVATKGGHLLGSHSLDIARNGHREHLKRACEASLSALGVERIDLYQLHSADPEVSLAESLGALVDLQREGKIRHIGVSNLGRRALAEAKTIAPIVSAQSRLSLFSREAAGVASWCKDNDVLFLCYGPLGRERASELSKLTVVTEIAAKRGATVHQIALAWLLAQGRHILPLPGATSAEQAVQNAAARDLKLQAGEFEALNDISP
jgi:aryl-alcohol dehydrogenase-like predicted oxidoreductase